MNLKIGFIGLGHMGQPMAKNLLKADYILQVYDVLPALTRSLCEQGATLVSSLKVMAQEADVIISSVQTSDQVYDICMGPDGIFTHANPDLLYIDCSSI